jgi:hypothetical protein
VRDFTPVTVTAPASSPRFVMAKHLGLLSLT